MSLVGAELEATIPLNGAKTQRLKPRLAVTYQVDALASIDGNTSLEATVNEGNGSFLSSGQNRGTNTLTMGGSLNLELSSKATLYASASYETYSNGSEVAYGGGVRVSF